VPATINATLSSASANSYVTLADANSYFETVPNSATWTDKTDDQKNRALISATRWIDSLNFYGDRCNADQALKWPRNNYDVDNITLSCSVIPSQIKYATYELARALANDTDAITNTESDPDELYQEVTLGDLKVRYKDSKVDNPINNIFDVYPWLQSYLGAYSAGGVGGYQLRVFRG
jgi:hypothetical protein